LKRFFDRWSNRVFYRDAYDAQDLLDQLNKALVSTIDLDKLLAKSAEVINSSIKAEFIVFGIKEIDGQPQRIIGTKDKHFSEQDVAAVRAVTPSLRAKIIVTDELSDNKSELRTKL